MTEAIDYVKTELMPDFDFDAFNHENTDNFEGNAYEGKKESDDTSAASLNEASLNETPEEAPTGIAAAATPEVDAGSGNDEDNTNTEHEEVDKW